MRLVPCMSVLGFMFGCCLTVIIALLFLPKREFWPSTYEDRLRYLEEITLKYHFSYRTGIVMFNHSNALGENITRYETEGDYLNTKAKMLCYSIEQEADDETHAALILTTWGIHCDKTIMFYTSPRLLDKSGLHPRFLRNDSVISLVYVDPSNSTIGTLLEVLSKFTKSYNWFVYVPPRVFLLPSNLKYYLIASKIDPNSVAFSGKPEMDKLFGSWSVSEKSLLSMSTGAISQAAAVATSSCKSDNIQDPGCLIEVTKGKMLDLRNAAGEGVITQIQYGNFFIKYSNVNVKDNLKMRFPVSVYIKGSYKNLVDLEYYLHHLKAYGINSITGGYTKKVIT